MRIKTVIKRIVIGIAIFFAAMIVLGIILQLTGYQPPAKPEQAQPLAEVQEEQADDAGEPQAPQSVETVEPQQEVIPEPTPIPALLEPIDPARTGKEDANALPGTDPVQAPVAPLFASVNNFRKVLGKFSTNPPQKTVSLFNCQISRYKKVKRIMYSNANLPIILVL